MIGETPLEKAKKELRMRTIAFDMEMRDFLISDSDVDDTDIDMLKLEFEQTKTEFELIIIYLGKTFSLFVYCTYYTYLYISLQFKRTKNRGGEKRTFRLVCNIFVRLTFKC